MNDLEEQLGRQDRALKALQVEWSEMYDKFRLLLARLTRRQEREAAESAAPAAQEPRRDTISRPRMVGDLPEQPPVPGARRNY